MAATCTVTKNGSSLGVVLPAEWRKANKIKPGDVLEVRTDISGQITFRKPPADKTADRFGHLFSLVDSLPSIPWEGGSSPADDKRELGERCAF